MANLEIPLDISNIDRRLWMGACPPFDRDLPEIDMLVLCAREIQPKASEIAYRGQVLRCPLPDDRLTTDEMHAAVAAAKTVATARVAGRRVLITCMQGRNRSGLVTALSLGMTTRASPAQIIELIRKRRRHDALSNPHFCQIIERLVRR